MLYSFLLFAQDAAKPQQEQPWWGPLPMFLILIVLGYLLLIAPMRRERRQREALISRLKKNDRVITNAGIIATVTNIKDEEVTLRIDDTSNARLTVLRSSIARILTAEEQAKEAATSGTAASTNIKAS